MSDFDRIGKKILFSFLSGAGKNLGFFSLNYFFFSFFSFRLGHQQNSKSLFSRVGDFFVLQGKNMNNKKAV